MWRTLLSLLEAIFTTLIHHNLLIPYIIYCVEWNIKKSKTTYKKNMIFLPTNRLTSLQIRTNYFQQNHDRSQVQINCLSYSSYKSSTNCLILIVQAMYELPTIERSPNKLFCVKHCWMAKYAPFLHIFQERARTLI